MHKQSAGDLAFHLQVLLVDGLCALPALEMTGALKKASAGKGLVH